MDGIARVETFRDFIAPTAALVEESVLTSSEDTLRLQTLNPANNASVTTTLPVNVLETYDTTTETEVVGVDVDDLDTILALFPPKTRVRVTTPPHSESVTISIADFEYKTHPINPQTIRQEPKDFFTGIYSTFTCSSDSVALKRSFTAADLCGQTIRIQTGKQTPVVEFSASGDTDDMYHPVYREDLLATHCSDLRATYRVSKLITMRDALAPRTDQLTFQFDAASALTLTGVHTATSAFTRYVLLSRTEGTDEETRGKIDSRRRQCWRARDEPRVDQSGVPVR